MLEQYCLLLPQVTIYCAPATGHSSESGHIETIKLNVGAGDGKLHQPKVKSITAARLSDLGMVVVVGGWW